jgi:hypothetical protein
MFPMLIVGDSAGILSTSCVGQLPPAAAGAAAAAAGALLAFASAGHNGVHARHNQQVGEGGNTNSTCMQHSRQHIGDSDDSVQCAGSFKDGHMLGIVRKQTAPLLLLLLLLQKQATSSAVCCMPNGAVAFCSPPGV